MATIITPAKPAFPDVYLIDTNDDVLGGEEGVANRQAIQLAERTAYLKKFLEEEIFNRGTTDDELSEIIDGIKNSLAASINDLSKEVSKKANINNPALTGTPKAPTAAAGTNSEQIATTAFVRTAITALINSSPAALDTLKELAAALGNDANFATTMTNALAGKAPLANPKFSGTVSVPEKTSVPTNSGTSVATEAQILANVANSLTDASMTKSLSAAQGRALQTNKAPANVALAADTGSGTNTDTPTVPSATVGSVLQTMWGKIRQIANVAKSNSINTIFPVGCSFIQYPGDQSPVERGLPGSWMDWGARAEIYGVSSTNPSSYIAYSSGGSIAANAYAKYTSPEGDIIVVRAKQAMTNLPAVIDPLQWLWPGESGHGLTITRVRRRDLQTSWSAADLSVGVQITSGTHNGKYVVEKVVMGGKFLSFEGGNRPTYITGGVARDAIRNIEGWFAAAGVELPASNEIDGELFTNLSLNWASSGYSASNQYAHKRLFDASRVVPVGPENSPRTLSSRYWRRVA